MRLEISFDITQTKNNEIPINYQHIISKWINNLVYYQENPFSNWLKKNGYTNEANQFGRFTFSRLNVPERMINGDRLRIMSNNVSLVLSFNLCNKEEIERLIIQTFINQSIQIGDYKSYVKFKVSNIHVRSNISFQNKMTFHTISPLVIAYNNQDNGYIRYLTPKDDNYEKVFVEKLINKFLITHTEKCDGSETEEKKAIDMQDISFKIISEPKKNGINIIDIDGSPKKIIGYLYKFAISAPHQLIENSFYNGFGDLNYLGFGCTLAQKHRNKRKYLRNKIERHSKTYASS